MSDDEGPTVHEALAIIREDKRKIKVLQDEVEELQERVTPVMLGHETFLTADGEKVIAKRYTPEKIEVDLGLLAHLVDKDTYDSVVKHTIDAEKFRFAVSSGRIPREVFRKTARMRELRSYVKFEDPTD